MAENKNDKEISELLSKLREKTVAEASAEKSKKQEKSSGMTEKSYDLEEFFEAALQRSYDDLK